MKPIALCTILLLTAGIAQAQVVALQSGPTTRVATAPAGPKIVKIQTYPQAAPAKAMEVQFAYSADELQEGNAALLYYQALLYSQLAPDSNAPMKITEDLNTPLSKLSLQDAEQHWRVFQDGIHFMELAAKKKSCDWGYPYSDGVSMRIPPLSQFRNMGRALALKARVHLARKEYDQAMETIRQGYTFARQVGSEATLINGLVGIAISELMSDEVQEAIRTPGTINMYWALSSLPSSLVEIKDEMAYERILVYLNFPQLKDIRSRQMTPQQWTDLLTAIVRQMSEWGAYGDLPPALMVMRLYPPARLYLTQHGYSAREMDAMSPQQAVLIYMVDEYEHWRDEMFKWYLLPYPQARKGQDRTDKEFQAAVAKGARMNPLIGIIPTLSRARLMQAKADRSIAALRTIEAIRIYSADNGKLPQSLDDLAAAPAATDPTTGKSFEYKVDGNSFTLSSLAPNEPADQVVYEVTVESKAATATAPAKTGKGE